MKKYVIYAFESHGTFICKEVLQPAGEIFLIGTFTGKKKEYSFIKSHKDIVI